MHLCLDRCQFRGELTTWGYGQGANCTESSFSQTCNLRTYPGVASSSRVRGGPGRGQRPFPESLWRRICFPIRVSSVATLVAFLMHGPNRYAGELRITDPALRHGAAVLRSLDLVRCCWPQTHSPRVHNHNLFDDAIPSQAHRRGSR